MKFLSENEILDLQRRIISTSGGALGVRDWNALYSSVAQPLQTFGGEDVYPGPAEKAEALGFFLIANHPFLDGNKRVGHAALEVTLLLHGMEMTASVEEQERAVASGTIGRESFTHWVLANIARTH